MVNILTELVDGIVKNNNIHIISNNEDEVCLINGGLYGSLTKSNCKNDFVLMLLQIGALDDNILTSNTLNEFSVLHQDNKSRSDMGEMLFSKLKEVSENDTSLRFVNMDNIFDVTKNESKAFICDPIPRILDLTNMHSEQLEGYVSNIFIMPGVVDNLLTMENINLYYYQCLKNSKVIPHPVEIRKGLFKIMYRPDKFNHGLYYFIFPELERFFEENRKNFIDKYGGEFNEIE